MSIFGLAFLSPWLLAGLAALPVIYWLLRTVPPRPRQIEFPPTRILVGLENKEKTPAKTPWWLMLIRMLAATLVILALADPVLNANREGAIGGSGPLVIAVDNGWSAASHWALRTRMIERLIDEAESQRRPVIVLPTAAASRAPTVRIEAPNDARSTAAALQPQPYEPDRPAAAAALEGTLAGQSGVSAVWLADGIDHNSGARGFADKLTQLAGAGLFVVETGSGEEALGLSAAVGSAGKLEASVIRAAGGDRQGILHAFSSRGQRLGEAPFHLGTGEQATRVTFDLPLELRNQVTRIEIAGEPSAGAVNLLDARSQWHRIGLISGESQEQAQPLLGPLYYIQRALAPYAELVHPADANVSAGVDAIFKQHASVVVLADIGTLSGELKTRVDDWIKKGGVLVRFAGPRLEKGGDDLLPVPLRLGGRTLGGALSWSTPQPLAPFPDDSIFAGLSVPADITVNRQVLADPARLGTDVRVWARLKDGTPLVTAAAHGAGQIVLFHVTANADWSNLPLSGLFVEMLRRITTLGQVAGGTEPTVADTRGSNSAQSETNVLAPLQALDGFGILRPPPATAQAISVAELAKIKPSPQNPPGYYGAQGAPRALNLIGPQTDLRPLPSLPSGVGHRSYEAEAATPLKPTLLALALALLFADIVAVIIMQLGGLSVRALKSAGRVSAAITLVAAASVTALVSFPARPGAQPANNPPGSAAGAGRQIDDVIALSATSKVTFGYVLTGDANTDDTSRRGLIGLGKVLTARTAVEPGDPMGVNIATDEIAFFPILYWPVPTDARALPEAALAKIDAYMKQGGLIIFDTRDFGQGIPLGYSLQREDAGTPLQRLLGRLDIPRLEPVPEGHVLTKSFYLLRSFPGRWDGGQLWVEADLNDSGDQGRKGRRADGVSSILVTSNDFAAAWALDERNRPIFPTVPGGEGQREQSYRTGINIVMYALTGNYKADQVHVPALLERLGQ